MARGCLPSSTWVTANPYVRMSGKTEKTDRERGQRLMPLLSLPIRKLFSQSELVYDCTVALDVYLLQVVEQVSSVTDHLLQTAAAVEVLLVGLQVCGQVVDAGGQNSDLNLGRTGVSLMGCVLLNQRELFVFLHGIFHLSFIYAFHSVSGG